MIIISGNLLVVGAVAAIPYAHRYGARRSWLEPLLAQRTAKIAAAALAHKNARMAWAIMTSGECYREAVAAEKQSNTRLNRIGKSEHGAMRQPVKPEGGKPRCGPAP